MGLFLAEVVVSRREVCADIVGTYLGRVEDGCHCLDKSMGLALDLFDCFGSSDTDDLCQTTCC